MVGTPTGTKKRYVPVGQRAKVRVSGQVCLQPFALCRIEVTATRIPTIRVKRDQMPGPNLVTVIASSLSTGSRPIILEVSGGRGIGGITASAARLEVLMVANHRMGYGFNATPGRVVRLQEGLIPPAIILIISKRQYGGKASIYQQV